MAATPKHGQLDNSTQGVHAPHQYTFPDAASRTGAPASRLTGGASKLALQTNDFSLWLLSSVSPTPIWVQVGSGSAGNDATGQNLGTGIPLFKEAVSGDLQFRTIVGGYGVNVTSATSLITVTASAPSATNIGTGASIYRETAASLMNFKTLLPGAGVNLTEAASTVTITASAGGGGGDVSEGANIGTGFGVFRERDGASLLFKSLVGGNNVTLASAASTITITANPGSAASPGHFSFTVGASSNWNNETIPVWQAPRGASVDLLEVDAAVLGTTSPQLAFNIERRAWQSLPTAGDDIFATEQNATASGAELTTFATSRINPRDHLIFTTDGAAETGSVNYVHITVHYGEI